MVTRCWPAAVGAVVFLVVLGAQIASSLHATGGELTYPLDDAYIHLAMAKTLATHGVFGITPHAFSASSSSPAWLVLLAAAMLALGKLVWLPLALSVAAAIGLLAAVDVEWRRSGLTPRARAAGSVLIVLLVPLPTLAGTGMEHCLHALLAVLFVGRVAGACRTDAPGTGRAVRAAAILAPLAVAVRFESLFLVAPAALLLWRRRGLAPALVVGAAAGLPVLALGAYSWSHGHFFLPTSVVLKTSPVPVPGMGGADHGVWTGARALVRYGRAGVLLLAIAFALWWTRARHDPTRRTMLLVVGAGLVLHAQFARFGWFHRYDAYLIVLGITVVAAALPGLGSAGRGARAAGILLALLAGGTYVPRAWRALNDPPAACRHTFLQNVQVGRFVAAGFDREAIAVNDIGAVSWFSNARTVDLVGLADIEVARARLAGTFDAAFVDRLTNARGVTTAVVYEDWFAGHVPAHWQRVARWTVDRPFWGPTVAFFAVDPASAPRLREALERCRATLPDGVRVE